MAVNSFLLTVIYHQRSVDWLLQQLQQSD